MRAKILIAVMTVAALAACSNNGAKPAPSPSPSGRVAIASTAHLKILAPTPGQTVQGKTFDVKVEVTGAKIVKQVSTHITPDTGHLHLSLDGNIVTILAGATYRLTNLIPGTHVLQAQFVAADHGPFNPRVFAAVTFRVT